MLFAEKNKAKGGGEMNKNLINGFLFATGMVLFILVAFLLLKGYAALSLGA